MESPERDLLQAVFQAGADFHGALAAFYRATDAEQMESSAQRVIGLGLRYYLALNALLPLVPPESREGVARRLAYLKRANDAMCNRYDQFFSTAA